MPRREPGLRELTIHMSKIGRRSVMRAATIVMSIVAGSACGMNALLNSSSASSDFALPTGAPAPRAIQVGFLNNTPFRAIFTAGAYDGLDDGTIPTNILQGRLEGNTASAQVAQPCRRVYSVAGDELIRLVELNRENPQVNVTDEAAMEPFVKFSGAALGDPLEAEATEGTAVGSVRNIGVDFTCARSDASQTTGTGLLIFTFEQDATAPGGFRVDFMFVAP